MNASSSLQEKARLQLRAFGHGKCLSYGTTVCNRRVMFFWRGLKAGKHLTSVHNIIQLSILSQWKYCTQCYQTNLYHLTSPQQKEHATASRSLLLSFAIYSLFVKHYMKSYQLNTPFEFPNQSAVFWPYLCRPPKSPFPPLCRLFYKEEKNMSIFITHNILFIHVFIHKYMYKQYVMSNKYGHVYYS